VAHHPNAISSDHPAAIVLWLAPGLREQTSPRKQVLVAGRSRGQTRLVSAHIALLVGCSLACFIVRLRWTTKSQRLHAQPNRCYGLEDSCCGSGDLLMTRLRKWSSTKRRMAEDKLPCFRSLSIRDTTSCTVNRSARAMSFRLVQNASSRLTLVLCPSITTERFITGDFIKIGPIVGAAAMRWQRTSQNSLANCCPSSVF
jgi:hypothetical protein